MKTKLIKYICIVVTAAAVFTGCGNGMPAPSFNTASSSLPAGTVQSPTIAEDGNGFVLYPKEGTPVLENLSGKKIGACVLLEDQFQRMLQITMKKTAEKYGATVVEGHSNGELDKEVAEINNFTTSGIDGMCIFPISAQHSVPALENAAKNGVQIYCVNTDTGADWQLGYAKMDQYGIGVGVGKYARQYILQNFKEKKPNVAIMQFKALIPELSKERFDGFLSQTQDLINIVQDVDAWDPDTAVSTAAEVMDAHQDLDMFFVMNEGGTVGTVMAIKNAGKKIPVFGIDASEQLAGMLLDSDNILQAVCGQDPIALGSTGMENLCLAMMGKPYKTGIKLPGVPLTRNNPEEVKAYVVTLKQVLGE